MLTALVFFSALVVDWVWAVYIQAAAERRPLAASIYGAVIFALGAGMTLAYVETPWLIAVGAVGGGIGTYFGVRRGYK